MTSGTTTPALRLLVLVGHDLGEVVVKQLVAGVEKSLLERRSEPVELVDSRTWWSESFARTGGWDSWAYETVCGLDYSTRQLHFSGIIVVTEPLGQANGTIVELAKLNGLLVLKWCQDTGLSVWE